MPTETSTIMPEKAVAVIGAGPGGLASARWLLAQGFEPVIFEASARLGGQWNSASASSATWPGMRTNTSRIMTAFSDLEHRPGMPTYVPQEEMLDYLERYAFASGLLPHLRLSTRVEAVERQSGGRWLIRSTSGERVRQEFFSRVVIATGRHNVPDVPVIPGLESFDGMLGAAHTAQYNGPERYRGRKVVVAGCSISALEIAADLAYGGASQVISAVRRQRYVFPKLMAGVPTEHVMFTRAAALLGNILPCEILSEGLKFKALQAGGNPARYGAQAPSENIFEAGITQSQAFLPAVAEGRILARPWIERIEGRTVFFSDFTSVEADAILFGTGYRLSLPWLHRDIAEMLGLDGKHIDLADHSFHPDLPGLAFVGLYDLVGPYLPVLELQARWVAYCFSGVRPMPSRAELEVRLAASRAERAGPPSKPMNDMALLFARRAGVEPDVAAWPDIERALLFGPLAGSSFRLSGPDSQPDAPAKVAKAAAAFGAIEDNQMTREEAETRTLVAPLLMPNAA